MTHFDYLVLTIIVISTILGLIRGLIKELLSLCAYAAAFIGAIWWGPRVSVFIETFIDNPLLRAGLSYLVVFIVVLLLVGLINITLAALIQKTGLSPADHGLGSVFGFMRGLVMVLALVVLGGYTQLPQEEWWQNAKLSGASEQAIIKIKGWLPPPIASWLPY